MKTITVSIMENKTSSPTKTYERTKNKKSPLSILRSGELPVEYENVCRLCLNKRDLMFDIYKDDDVVPISVKIKTLLTVRVEEYDELPTMICEECLATLNEFYKFKKRCIANDIQLRQCIIRLPPKKIENFNDKNLNLENEYLDPLEQKNDCTIDWDDQVPLAGIIITKYESLNRIQTGKNRKQQCSPTLPEEVDLTGDSETRERSNNGPVQSEVTDSETTDRQQVKNHPALNEDDYDEMPLAQRFIFSKMIEDKTIQISRRKNPKKIVNLDIECKDCKKFVPALSSCENHGKNCLLPYKCAECSKTFRCLSTLNRHHKVHTGVRPFSCDTCGRAFSQKETLQRHIKQLHSQIRPFECQYCDKRFSLSFLLNAHIKTAHTARQKYHCNICSKVFHYSSGLSRHKKNHNGAQYSCKVCQKKFGDSSSMRRHMKVIHHSLIE